MADLFREYPDSKPSDFIRPEEIIEMKTFIQNQFQDKGIESVGIRINGCFDYPERLRDANNPIEAFYFRGNWELIEHPKKAAIVGSRNVSVAKDSVFVTDSLRPYQKLSLDMNLSHIRIPRGKRAVGTFNIQMINNYHSRLKNMIVHRFKGVATKYLNNYLVYHNFVNFAKDTLTNKEAILLDFIRKTMCSVRSQT